MKLICIAIGKKHDTAISAAIVDYTQRLRRYFSFDWQLLPAVTGRMSVEEIKRSEGAVIAAQIKDDDYIVLLDEGGRQLTSSGLAGVLETFDTQNTKRIVFVIGGAYGVTDELKRRANILWSLSKLTFPHQLVRLVFVEQLYRANTIRRGEPYHHE